MSMVYVVGLSIDFSFHMANEYTRSSRHYSINKLQFSLNKLGVSTLYSAITSIFIGSTLMGAYSIYFWTMGLFILVSSAVAAIFTLFLYPFLLDSLGPEGNVRTLYKLNSIAAVKEATVNFWWDFKVAFFHAEKPRPPTVRPSTTTTVTQQSQSSKNRSSASVAPKVEHREDSAQTISREESAQHGPVTSRKMIAIPSSTSGT